MGFQKIPDLFLRIVDDKLPRTIPDRFFRVSMTVLLLGALQHLAVLAIMELISIAAIVSVVTVGLRRLENG
jgi:hypothetical protein